MSDVCRPYNDLVSVAVANFEFSWPIPPNCVGIGFQVREPSIDLRWSMRPGVVATSSETLGNYFTTCKAGQGLNMLDKMQIDSSKAQNIYFGAAAICHVELVVYLRG